MPGTNAGTGQPLFLKCSRCKKERNPAFPFSQRTTTSQGNLVRTGRTRPRRLAKGMGARNGHMRIGDTAHECRCLDCGHIGWYCHKDAERRPLAKP